MRNSNSLPPPSTNFPNNLLGNSLLNKFQFIIDTATIFGKVTKKNYLLLGNCSLNYTRKNITGYYKVVGLTTL